MEKKKTFLINPKYRSNSSTASTFIKNNTSLKDNSLQAGYHLNSNMMLRKKAKSNINLSKKAENLNYTSKVNLNYHTYGVRDREEFLTSYNNISSSISPHSKTAQQYKLKKKEQQSKQSTPKNLPRSVFQKDNSQKWKANERPDSPKMITIKTPSAKKIRQHPSISPSNKKFSSGINNFISTKKEQSSANKIYTPREISNLKTQNDNYSELKIDTTHQFQILDKYAKKVKTQVAQDTPKTSRNLGTGIHFYKGQKKGYDIKPYQQRHTIKNYYHQQVKRKTKRLPQTTIKDFQLLKKLGKGQNGQIYSAVHKPTGLIVALKHFQQKKVVIDYLIDEMKIQLFCEHQNVLPALGYIIEKSNSKLQSRQSTRQNSLGYDIFLIMQKGDCNLFSLIRKYKRFPEQETAIFTQQILKGLKHLHDQNIIHRDVKPENIIVVNGICKITDFGWSIITTEERQTFCGTLEYVSPQVAKGHKYDKKIDAWSVGVLIYQMLTGQAPFDSQNILEKPTEQYRKRILNRLPENTTNQCKQLIALLLRINPNSRITVQEALEHRWIKEFTKRKTLKKKVSVLEEEFSKVLYNNKL